MSSGDSRNFRRIESAQIRAARFELFDPLRKIGKLDIHEAQSALAVWVGAQEEKYFVIAKQSFGVRKSQSRQAGKQPFDGALFVRAESTLQFIELIKKAIEGVSWQVLLTQSGTGVHHKCFRINVAIFQASMAFQGSDAIV
jgi:hypothetical protein